MYMVAPEIDNSLQICFKFDTLISQSKSLLKTIRLTEIWNHKYIAILKFLLYRKVRLDQLLWLLSIS